MAYTSYGRTQRANLLKASQVGDDLLNALRPLVEKVPGTVITRVKSTGSNEDKTFSAYSPDWAGVRSRKGLQTGKKDFYFDGTMWDSYKITKEGVTAMGITFVLGTTAGMTRKSGQFLSDIHSDNEGTTILDITDDEWDDLEDEMMVIISKKIGELIR